MEAFEHEDNAEGAIANVGLNVDANAEAIANDDGNAGNALNADEFVKSVVEYENANGNWKLVINVKKKSGDSPFTLLLNRVASKNGVAENKYKKIKNNTKTIGMVFYMESGYANNLDDNYIIHIPMVQKPSPFPELINVMLKKIMGYEIRQIIAGHEHGDLNGKCHIQTAVEFNVKITKLLNPGKVDIFLNEEHIVSLLFMQQVAHSSFKLKEYCKKDNDYTLLNKDLEIIEVKNDKDKVDFFKTIVENKEKLTSDEATEILQRKTSRDYFVNFSNINKALKTLVNDPLPDFKWGNFDYLKDFTVPMQNLRVSFYPIFEKWFKENCLENPIRKVSLCLYSAKRGLGKTMFARSLVNHEGYLLEYNNTFCEKFLSSNDPYRLLLLDDMKDIDKKNYQMWRSLVAGQKTTIRDAYCNEVYDLCLPCVITTNSLKMITIFTKDPMFYTQVITIEIDKYMGPPGTYDDRLYKRQCFISDYTSSSVFQQEAKRQRENERKKDDY